MNEKTNEQTNEQTKPRGILWPGEISFERFVPLFEAKYGLSYFAKDFWIAVEQGIYMFYCPSLPRLTEMDLMAIVPNPTRLSVPLFSDFFDAYAEKEKGNDEKMKSLLSRYGRVYAR